MALFGRTRRTRRPITAPEGQGVTFVELFFDLVFVFALTQVTKLLAHDLSWGGALRSALVFWLVWWAWTQFTWALNGGDTTRTLLRIGTLLATGIAFLMAIWLPGAFDEGGGIWFIVPYIAIRLTGLGMYLRVAAHDPEWFRAVRIFHALSLLGLAAAFIGGLADPAHRAWWWLTMIGLDLLAAAIGGQQAAWSLVPGHFAERHGLFVIIALGESLVAAALPATTAERTMDLVVVAIGAVALTCLLWWTYFGWFKDALEKALERMVARDDATFARDAYSLMHMPLAAGVIAIAVGLEEMVAHPGDPLHAEVLVAYAVGTALFVGMAVVIWLRAQGRWLVARTVALAALLVGIASMRDAAPGWVLAFTALIVAAIAVAERGFGASASGARPS